MVTKITGDWEDANSTGKQPKKNIIAFAVLVYVGYVALFLV
jgi:hypothetical protein